MKSVQPANTPRLLSSVRSAAQVLCALGEADNEELGVSELSRRLGLSKSAVHRLLRTLAAERLVDQNALTGRYQLGVKLFELGTRVPVHGGLHEAVAAHIDELRTRTGETVQVGVLDGIEVVYVERRESLRTLRTMVEFGHRNLAHCTGCGKVILAGLPEAELDRILGSGVLPARTEQSITDPASLKAELAAVRRRGYAENLCEGEHGMASVAAPIRNLEGREIAGISVAAPIERMGPDVRGRHAAAVVDTAQRISEQLGYRGRWRKPT